ncbi:MAG: hypothetical protein AB1324_01665 [Candidatus Micrarchaeota archaeon]
MKSSLEKLASLRNEVERSQAGVQGRMEAAGLAVSAVFEAHKGAFEKAYPSCALGLCETRVPGTNFALVMEGRGIGGSIHATAALGEDRMTLTPTGNSGKKAITEVILPPESVSALRKAETEFLGAIGDENALAAMRSGINACLNAAMDFAGTVGRLALAGRPDSKNQELEALRGRADSAIGELKAAALEIMEIGTEQRR